MLMEAGVNLPVAFAGAGVISRGETPQLGWNPQYRNENFLVFFSSGVLSIKRI